MGANLVEQNPTMNNKKNTFLYILIVIIVIAVFFVSIKIVKSYYDFGNHCFIVNGHKHVYRGQCLPSGYKVNLVDLSDRANYLKVNHQISVDAKEPLEKLIVDAEKDGMCLVVIGSYRSPEYQLELLNKADDKTFVAPPNQSEHQTGLAVDFVGCPMKDEVRDDIVQRLELKNDFDQLPEYQWLLNNAGKYGFEQSFSKSNQKESGYPSEEWHWKFIIK